jgi:hypothetical protein
LKASPTKGFVPSLLGSSTIFCASGLQQMSSQSNYNTDAELKWARRANSYNYATRPKNEIFHAVVDNYGFYDELIQTPRSVYLGSFYRLKNTQHKTLSNSQKNTSINSVVKNTEIIQSESISSSLTAHYCQVRYSELLQDLVSSLQHHPRAIVHLYSSMPCPGIQV